MNREARPNLFRPEIHRECVSRIETLTPETRPRWGTMTVAQMLAHCAEAQEVTNGKELRGTPFLVKLFRGLVRRVVVGDKAYGRGLRTHPQYVQTADRDFTAEKERLLRALQRFVDAGEKGEPLPDHPLFGKMTPEEKGWSMYKHLDHHLRQFGV